MNTYTNIYTNTDIDKHKHKTLSSLLYFKDLLDSVFNITCITFSLSLYKI